MTLKLSVNNRTDAAAHGSFDLMSSYDCDRGVLAIPSRIALHTATWDGHKIMDYNDIVGEYDIWLDDMINAQDRNIMVSLDHIYNKALGSGIILLTHRFPTNKWTHAHCIERLIKKLAGEDLS